MMMGRERLVVVGDLHIGIEEKYSQSGIAFPNAARRTGAEIRRLCEGNNARGVVLLGDVKHSLGNLARIEREELVQFFGELRGMDIFVAKGNHDAYLGDMLSSMNIEAHISKEIMFPGIALMHGNSMPSEEAVMKRYMICGHAHLAARVNGIDRKVWMVAPCGPGMKEGYSKYNKRIKLVVAPAFNRLITGSRIGSQTEGHLPFLNNRLFDFPRAKVYDLDGNELE